MKGNIGGAINAFCNLVPDDDWICIRDQDTLMFPGSGDLIESIVQENRDYSLIGCMTNRLRAPYQCYEGRASDNSDIIYHKKIADELSKCGPLVTEIKGHIAGMFMLFPKSVWNKIKFHENTLYFDRRFSDDVKKSRGKIGIAQGLYLFHYYRLDKDINNIDHLL